MKGRKFGRMPSHRKAMMRQLTTNLIMSERMTTTLEKAKEMRPLMERLIHKAKVNTPQSHQYLKTILFNNEAISKLVYEIAPRFEDQPGGFTRVLYLGNRTVDKGSSAMIEILGNAFQTNEDNDELVD